MGSWSYCILGNDDIYDYLNAFIYTCASNLTEKEYEDFGDIEKFEDVPLKYRKYVIDKNINNLINLVKEDPRIDGYLALGVFITQNGATLTDDVKQFILENVIDEDDRFFDTSGWEQRKKHLADFREKIKNYSGEPQEYESKGLFETISNHIKKLRSGNNN
ncbi:MAG: hypothetical protein ACXAAH_04100 [Promethearchaeota archaeon]|jgi:hypothetical protein